MIPALVNFSLHTAGDTWLGVPTIGPIRMSVDGGALVAMPAPVASARLHWVQGENYAPAAKFATNPATGESPITLVNAANWELAIPPVAPALFPLTKGNWYAHLEITDTDGRVWTTHKCVMEVGLNYTQI